MEYLLTLVWLFCLISVLWIANITGPANGYELSLVNAYPVIFWVLTACSSISGILIIVLTSIKKTIKTNWWVSGAAAIILTNVFIISLTIFRGYAVDDRADSMNHVGYVQDIIRTGRISKEDFYPAVHFIQLALQEVGGVSPGAALDTINIFFIILWSLAISSFVYRVAKDIRPAYLSFAFSAPFSLLTYHTMAIPSTLSAIIVPVLMGLHFSRTENNQGRFVIVIAELIIAMFVVLLHPVTTLYLIGILVLLEGIRWIYLRRKKVAEYASTIQSNSSMATIMSIVFFSWYFSFYLLTSNLAKSILWLFGEQKDRGSAMHDVVATVQTASLPLKLLILTIFNSFGVSILVSGVAVALALFIIYLHLRNRTPMPYRYACLAGMLLISIFYMGGNFLISTAERYPLRLIRLLVIFGIGSIAWWSWDLLFGDLLKFKFVSATRKFLMPTIFLFMIGITILGQLNVYPHPRNGLPNRQVTRNELDGMEWLVYNRDPNSLQASILPEYYTRFEAYFKGINGRQDRANWWRDDIWLPSHFKNKEWSCMAQIAPDQETYLLLSKNGKIAPLRFPIEVRERAHIYLDADWKALAVDDSVNKLYDNGDFNVWVTRTNLSHCNPEADYPSSK